MGESGNREELNRTDIRTADRGKTQVHYATNMMTKNLNNGERGVGGWMGWGEGGESTVLVTRKEFYPKVVFFLSLLICFFFHLSNFMS